MTTYRIDADLQIQVGDEHGLTELRVRTEPTDSGLTVVDVDDPAALLRTLLGRGSVRRALVTLPGELSPSTISITSGQRHLMRLRLDPGRRIRIRPTTAGVSVALRATVSELRRRVGSRRRR